MLWQFEKPIVREFMHLALPTVLAGWVYIVYTITSGVFIGRFVGSQALAALNLILPVLYVPYAISLMIGIGAANVAAGLFQGFPVSTSSSRTAVAEQNELQQAVIPIEEALDIMRMDTRHYAKRQMTFVRSRSDFTVFENATTETVAEFLEGYDG